MNIVKQYKTFKMSVYMKKYVTILLSTVTLVAALLWLGVTTGSDTFFEEVSIRSVQTKASGQTVLVNIDTETITAYGGHPLKREFMASALQKLDQAGAQKIYVDALFSYQRAKASDEALAQVMGEIGPKRLALPVNGIVKTDSSGQEYLQNIASIAPFANHATPVFSELAFLGQKRLIKEVGRNRLGAVSDLPTVASWFQSGTQATPKLLNIDYGISRNSIPTISLKALIENKVSVDRIAGKNIIIGLTAQHVGEVLRVPYYGKLYRPEIIALSAETQLLNRAIVTVSDKMVMVLILMLSAFLGLALQRYTPLFGALMSFAVMVSLLSLAVILREKWLLNLPLSAPLLSVISIFSMVHIAFHPAFYRIRYTLQSFMDKIDLAQIQLLNSGKDAIITFTPEGVLLTMNHSAEKLFDKKAGHCIGSSIKDILPEHADQLLKNAAAHLPGRFQAHIPSHEKVSRKQYLDMSYNAMPSDDGWVGFASIRDISQFKAKEEKLLHAATHDSLTGLANRSGFDNHIKSVARLADDTDQTFAVLMIDLDKFKQVNDTLGHHVGDAVLETVLSG